jgi:hypothetical protein
MKSPLAKMAEAHRTLLRMTKNPEGSECVARLDRLQGYCVKNPTSALTDVPGFQGSPIRRLRRVSDKFQPYACVQWFQSTRNGAKFVVDSERMHGFVDPFRITFFADDVDGLLRSEIFRVLELVPDFRMTMVELAFDFTAGLNRRISRQEGLFGKSRPIQSVGSTDYWGTRKGMKRVQCYFKQDVHAFRVELEMHVRFLKHYQIRSPLDFHKFIKVLPMRHIRFGVFSEQKLRRRMSHMGLTARQKQEVLRMVEVMRGDLWGTLNYLRQEWQISNARRLVDDSPRNEAVVQALTKWLRGWPATPTRLGGAK